MEIKVQDVSKSFDNKSKVLENLNLTVFSGSLTTLLGLSGCGKTTLLRIIAGLEKADTGKVLLGDRVVFDKNEHIDVEPFKRNVAFVFQDFALWPNMTVIENVMLALSSRENKKGFSFFDKKKKEERKEKALAALRMVKMEEYATRLPSELSGGQKQRVAIARAISISPDVILFDEPFSALDAVLRQEMREEIRNLVKELKITALFVTHDQEEAMSISDSIIVMNKGRIEEQGKPEDIYWHPKTKFVANFVGKATFLDEHHFLRPEDLSFEEREYKAILHISSSNCQGGVYNIIGKDEKGRPYYFTSSKPLNKDSSIAVYYHKESIREVC